MKEKKSDKMDPAISALTRSSISDNQRFGFNRSRCLCRLFSRATKTGAKFYIPLDQLLQSFRPQTHKTIRSKLTNKKIIIIIT